MFSTRIKIVVGYAVLAIVLFSATWMMYDNTRSLTTVNHASEQMLKRRDVVDSIVCYMLETANAERSIMLGDTDEWQRLDRSLSNCVDKTRHLRPLLDNRQKQLRLDSLIVLLEAKRKNTLQVMAELDKNQRDTYYNNKVKALQAGRDSVVIAPKTESRHEQHETVYEIVKSRKGFFRRLGDAFRKQHTDTVGTTHIEKQLSVDTTRHRLNIADSVANALTEIQQEEQRAQNRQQNIIAYRNNRLQRVSLLLARRTGELLEDIQKDEQHAMQHAVDKAIESRYRIIKRIIMLGLLAILSATILIVYILRDIQRERRDHKRIVEAKAETERIMQQRERLLLTITHDLKAPAASIAGFIDLLSEYVDMPKAVGYLQNIAGSARHLQQLVSTLLDYHQLENGKAEKHESSFSPAKLVRECVDEMQPQAIAKNLNMKANINVAANTVCRTDPFRIKQIANNLIGNAIKYTERGTVTVSVETNANRMLLSVADTGCGMTDNEQQRIFGAFTRLDNANGKEGVGLGLSITRETVLLLGGTISVASKKGKGTVFTVAIPIDIVNSHEHKERNAENESLQNKCLQQPISTINLNKQDVISVLLVDDDRLQLQLINEMFERIGGTTFDITSATKATEALELANAIAPRLVLTDIEMPGTNGHEIIQRLKSPATNLPADTKFIAMTAHEASILPQLRQEGFDACLFKPFNVHTLAATISQLTGLMVSVTEHKYPDSETGNAIGAMLHTFADGDTEAERQIMNDIRRSIAEYTEMLQNPNDLDSIAHAAHKAMPLLEMVQPGTNEWLARLTPEHIGETEEKERALLIERLKDKLAKIERYSV